MKHVSSKYVTLVMSVFVVLASGCAQVAHKVDVLYSPQATYRGGTGTLELATADSAKGNKNTEPSMRWVVGHIKNDEGGVTGEIISPVRPQDVVSDAFKQELTAAGYKINFSKALDKQTGKGIVFTEISVTLEEVPSLVKLESSCNILLKIDLWANGTVINHTEYRSKVSDIAVKDRDQLSSDLYQKALQEVIQQAVPDIIRQLH